MQENLYRNKTDTKAYRFTKDAVTLHIQQHCWDKMHGWCQAGNGEVSGMGLIRKVGDVFEVYNVFLPLQYGTGAYTELDELAVRRLEYKLGSKGTNLEEFRFWWHTHYNFGTFWSGTDDNNAQRLAKCNENWQMSLVINQRRDWLARLDLIKPVSLTIDEIQVYISPNSRSHKKRNYKADIEKWVKPYSELPDRQKTNYATIKSDSKPDKEEKIGKPTNDEPKIGYQNYGYQGSEHRTYDYRPSWMMERYKERFGDKQYEKEKKKISPELGEFCGCYIDKKACICIGGCEGKCGEQTSQVTRRISDKYVLHKGVLITTARYDQIIAEEVAAKEPPPKPKCDCGHSGRWEECVCPADCNECTKIMSEYGYYY